MIALTQEKREELAKFAAATLNSLNGIEPENPNQYDDCLSEYTQMCMEIALESLTAEPTYSRYRLSAKGSGPDAKKSPWFAGDGKALRESHDVEVGNLFTSPPVPEIKFPGISELVDHQGCLPAVRDIEIFDFAISEIKRLNGLGE